MAEHVNGVLSNGEAMSIAVEGPDGGLPDGGTPNTDGGDGCACSSGAASARGASPFAGLAFLLAVALLRPRRARDASLGPPRTRRVLNGS